MSESLTPEEERACLRLARQAVEPYFETGEEPRSPAGPGEVNVGCHGIIVSKGFHRGLLLPQVPVEHGWDRETYLSHGCLKAGLPTDAWKEGAEIEVFTAQVFSE